MIRKLLAAIIFLFLAASSNGQIVRGNIYGDCVFNLSREKDVRYGSVTKEFSIAPNVGYALNPHIIVGLGVTYQSITESDILNLIPSLYPSVPTRNYYEIQAKTVAPGVFMKYAIPLGNRVSFILNVGCQYGLSGSDIRSQTQSGSYSNSSGISYHDSFFNASLSPEVLFLITKRIGAVLNFNGLDITSYKKRYFDETVEFTDYSANFSPANWSLGVVVLLAGNNNE